jgi:dipeptidyl aminopeptidase/acylaminoacyl peptidase
VSNTTAISELTGERVSGGDVRATTVSQAQRMAEAIRMAGRDARLRIYEGTAHQISIPRQWEQIDPFLEEMIGR